MVRILSVVDGCIPLSRSADIEEERRLLYVGMSRAKDQLDLIVPQQLFHQYQPNGPGQHHVVLKLTRFIPPSIIGLFERKARKLSKVIDISRVDNLRRERVWSNQSAK